VISSAWLLVKLGVNEKKRVFAVLAGTCIAACTRQSATLTVSAAAEENYIFPEI